MPLVLNVNAHAAVSSTERARPPTQTERLVARFLKSPVQPDADQLFDGRGTSKGAVGPCSLIQITPR
jgi:hypothetical protein